MRLLGKAKLVKLARKNRGNKKLTQAIEDFIKDFEDNDWSNEEEIKEARPDADMVHNDGFYFFDLNVHRTLVLVEFDDEGEATIAWVGSHDEYERVFRNNRNTIRKWLRSNGYIA